MYDYDRLVIQVHKISEINEYMIFGLVYKKRKIDTKYEPVAVARKDYIRLFGEKNAIKTAKSIAEDECDSMLYKNIVAVLFRDGSNIGDVIWREE